MNLTELFNLWYNKLLQVLSVHVIYVLCRKFFIYSLIILILLNFTILFWIPLAYCVYLMLSRRERERGNKRVQFFRHLKIWKYVADYFPIKLHRVSEKPFDPTKNYLFVSQPHGYYCIGIFVAMSTEALNWSKMFPGITPHVCSHDYLFYFPILRDFLLAFGHVGVNEKAFENLSNPPNKGKALGLIVGGGREMLLMYPNTYRFKLKTRKGYARMAIKHGSCLVPAISFGENDYFYTIFNPEGSLLLYIQNRIKDLSGLALSIIVGRGVVQMFGLMPMRRPINVVIGEPIEVAQCSNPTDEQINEVHELYKSKVTELFESEKFKYISGAENVKIQFV